MRTRLPGSPPPIKDHPSLHDWLKQILESLFDFVNRVFVPTGTGVPHVVDGVLQPEASGITGTDIVDGSLTPADWEDADPLSVLGNAINIPAVLQYIGATSGTFFVLREEGGTLVFSQIVTDSIKEGNVTFPKIQDITTDRLLGRDSPGTGDTQEISLGASLEFSGAGSVQRAALTGDVTAPANSNATTIANGAVSDAKLRDSAGVSVIGRAINSVGDPADIVAAANGEILGRNSNVVAFYTPERTMVVAHIDYGGRFLSGAAAASPPTLVSSDPTSFGTTSAVVWFAGCVCPDTLVTWAAFRFSVPPDLDTSLPITVEVGFIVASAAAANVELTIHWGGFADNDGGGAPGVSGSFNTVIAINPYAAFDYAVVVLSGGSISGLGSSRFVQGSIERDATAGNADDTYADLIGITHLLFYGEKKVA